VAESVHDRFFFEDFELVPSQRLLRGPSGDINLRSTSLDVLIYLVRAGSRLVPKEELLDAIWPDVTVTEDSLTKCISDIRSALSDGDRRILKTVSRRGYVLAAEVRTSQNSRPEPEPPLAAAPRQGSRWSLFVGILVIMVSLAGAMALVSGVPPAEGKPRLAILPLVGTEGGDSDYFAEGLTEDLSLALSRFGTISVIAPASAARFRVGNTPIDKIRDQLSARFLLTGSIRRPGDQMILTLQLTDARDEVEVWSGQYDGSDAGFFGARSELVATIASLLDRQITHVELDRIARTPSPDMTAYDFVLKADALLRNTEAQDRGANIAMARDLYERAAVIDPRYADALEGIANTYLLAWLEPLQDGPLGAEFQSPNVLEWAGDYARRAVELDDTSATARATLGWILNWQSGPTEGLVLYDQALELNPGLVDWRYGLLLSHGGRAEDAEAYMGQIMVVDPLHPPRYRYLLGKAYYFQGRYGEALPLIRQAAAQMPTHRPSHVLLAAISAEMGGEGNMEQIVHDVYDLDPSFTIQNWLAYIRISDSAYADRLRQGLLAAGFPEG
jgi:TolB-like protein/DNA-binding winged helix-turn-helix (wHTH) protein